MPYKPELTLRQLSQYRAWYCGLCKALRDTYGQLPRLVLGYDCTFLALLLAGLEGNVPPCKLGVCGYKPFRKERNVAQPCAALDFASDINILLFWFKLEDNWRDERKIFSLLARATLYFAAKKAKLRQPTAAAAINESLAALTAAEKENEASIDKAADYFALLLSKIVCGYPNLPKGQEKALSWLCYNLGRWIYLADAWEDRFENKKSGAYNVFLQANTSKEQAAFLLYASLFEVEKAYDLLDLKANCGLLNNIVYQGCRERTKEVLEGVKHESL